jgi:hypothetical protein
MDLLNTLKKYFPYSFGAKELKDLIIKIIVYVVAGVVIGTVASVDVTDLSDIQLWYGKQYQVLLGDTTQLGYKIQCMKSAIAKLEHYQQGILDVTFTTYPDQVPFRPFS